MAAQRLTVPWGDQEKNLFLPERWHLAGVLELSSLPGVADAVEEVIPHLDLYV